MIGILEISNGSWKVSVWLNDLKRWCTFKTDYDQTYPEVLLQLVNTEHNRNAADVEIILLTSSTDENHLHAWTAYKRREIMIVVSAPHGAFLSLPAIVCDCFYACVFNVILNVSAQLINK